MEEAAANANSEIPKDHANMMNNEYVRAREEFDPIFYIIGLLIFAALYWIINRDNKPA